MPMSAHPNVFVYLKPTIIFHRTIFSPQLFLRIVMMLYCVYGKCLDGTYILVGVCETRKSAIRFGDMMGSPYKVVPEDK